MTDRATADPGAAESPADYLTPRALASLLGVRVATLAKWRWAGSGPPYVALGASRILYVRKLTDEWLAARLVRSTADAQQRGLAVAPKNKGIARAR